MKYCPRCRRDREDSEFHRNKARYDGLAAQCKECFALIGRAQYGANKDRKLATSKAWYVANTARKRETCTAWDKANIERRREILRDAQRRRRATDDLFRVSQSVSVCVRRMLNGWKGRASWQSIVGYTIDDLRQHLEAQFSEWMNWANYGAVWEIDHIRPVVSFGRDASAVRECWALSNLQPLGVSANRSKGARWQ